MVYRLYSADNTLIAEYRHLNMAKRAAAHCIGSRVVKVKAWIEDFAE
jgi:hypothetical protein